MRFPIFETHTRLTSAHKLGIVIIAVFTFVGVYRIKLPFSREFGIALPAHRVSWGPLQLIDFSGFLNSGVLEDQSCDALKYNATIGVQKSRHIYDNLTRIALSLDQHPLIKFSEPVDDLNLTINEHVRRRWVRMSGSSVWIPKYGVFMVVSRISSLGAKEILSAPLASFLRGQVFDENWEHLDDYTITRHKDSIVFPLVFDIHAEYEGGRGEFYGPEDPRIILEDNVEDAEPVIIFNMAHSLSEWRRAMYLFRPFSNVTTILTIRGQERAPTEKNWSPFFLALDNSLSDSRGLRAHNEFLHFVYQFKPLEILKCHMRHGNCEFVFRQNISGTVMKQHGENGGNLHGGTNLIPVTLPASYKTYPEIQAYAAFPRTNVEVDCARGRSHFYRPEFVVLVKFGWQFYLAFASEALDFGPAILEEAVRNDCESGRILIPNSISLWDTRQDIMTVTWSVADRSVQVTRLYGVFSFVQSLPRFHELLVSGRALDASEREVFKAALSRVGYDVRACSVESSVEYALRAAEMDKLTHSLRLST